MKLPSKKVFIVVGLCVIVVALAGASKLKSLTVRDDNSKKAALSPESTTTPIILKSREFYEKAASTTPPTSLTDKLSQDFFLNFVSLKEQGKWDVENQAKLIDQLTTTYASSSLSGYKLSNIAVFSDRESEKVRLFGNTVAEVIQGYNPRLKTSPLDIISEAIKNEKGTTTLAAKLTPISRSYRALAKDLSKIPAPASLAPVYVDVINMYSRMAAGIDDMTAYFSDPVRGFIGINNYQASLVSQMYLLKNMADYFKGNGILFSDTEEGTIWTSLSKVQ